MEEHKPHLSRQGIGMMIGLIAQYILGMVANLYASFPKTTHENTLWSYAWTNLPTALHITLGTLLLIGSIAMLVSVFRGKPTVWQLPAVFGFIGILVSFIAGTTFISTQSNLFSFIMSLGFLVALLSYGWGLFISKQSVGKV